MTFRLTFPSEISKGSIKTFLLDLDSKGLLYHIDDDPREVFYNWTERTFTDAEAYALIGFWEAAAKVIPWDEIWQDCFPETNTED
jgi:hypothetical protein